MLITNSHSLCVHGWAGPSPPGVAARERALQGQCNWFPSGTCGTFSCLKATRTQPQEQVLGWNLMALVWGKGKWAWQVPLGKRKGKGRKTSFLLEVTDVWRLLRRDW